MSKDIKRKQKDIAKSFGPAPKNRKQRIKLGEEAPEEITDDSSWSVLSKVKRKGPPKKKKSSKKSSKKSRSSKGEKAVDNPEMKKSEYKD